MHDGIEQILHRNPGDNGEHPAETFVLVLAKRASNPKCGRCRVQHLAASTWESARGSGFAATRSTTAATSSAFLVKLQACTVPGTSVRSVDGAPG